MKKKTQDKVLNKLSAKGLVRTATVLLLMTVGVAFLAGCQTADPASRSNRTDYGGMSIVIKGNHNVATVDIGDGVTSDASGGGDTQSNTPTQTTDTKPEVAVGLGGGSAGTGGSPASSGIVGEALSKLMGILGGNGGKLTQQEAAAIKDCADGACSE